MNRPYFKWLAAGALLLAMLGCGKTSESTVELTRIAVIPKGTTHEFWKSVHAGARKAEMELNDAGEAVEIIWQGPLREDDRDLQIQVVENFASGRVEGIVLAPLDAQALVRPVKTAVSAGLPVVIIDSGLNSEDYVSFVATDNFKGGQIAADYLAELLEEKGKVILFRYAVGSASTEQREKGFLENIGKYPNIEILSSDQHAGATIELAYQTAQNLLNRFGNEVDGIFAVNETSTIGMTKALKETGRGGGEVKMVGFDAGSQSLEDFKNGDLQGLVVQNPLAMGYEGVMTLYRHMQGDSVPKRVDTGVVLVRPENFESTEVQELIHPPLERYLE